MSLTLTDLRLASRRRADMENSTFIADDEIDLYINNGYGELYDLLVSRFEDYFMKDPAPQSVISTGNSFALPADFYKFRGVDFLVNGSDWIDCKKYMFKERNVRNRIRNRISNGVFQKSYRVIGQKVYILPEDDAAGTYRLWYVPRFTRLVSGGDAMGDVLDFEDYVIVDAAIKMLTKEESDISALMLVKNQLKQRILDMSANRDAGDPERVTDTQLSGSEFEDIWPRG